MIFWIEEVYFRIKKRPIGIGQILFLFDYCYFFMIASMAANHHSSFSFVMMYSSSPGLPLKNVTAA
jgi:hypothetical protein